MVLDRLTARALVEAGYMLLERYLQMYDDTVSTAFATMDEADEAPACDGEKTQQKPFSRKGSFISAAMTSDWGDC